MINYSRQKLQTQTNTDIRSQIGRNRIERVDSTKSLGLTTDETLTWSKHVNNLSKRTSTAIGNLKRVRPFINQDTSAIILIEPYFNYYCSIWGGFSQQ